MAAINGHPCRELAARTAAGGGGSRLPRGERRLRDRAGVRSSPHLITAPFHAGLGVAFGFAIVADVITAAASALTGPRRPAPAARESLGYELAAVSGEGGFEPGELVVPGVREESGESPGQPGSTDRGSTDRGITN